ncbi:MULTISPECIES: outer membrane protein [unclassified Mesorhizobium]|uniref:outer membrane protein n=1 Tax=unclassified Mesorhizobium TaxID=325217 RepID=UPI000FCA0E60|nr:MULTISPECIES: outer membrane protein [unclassified Mesorhizobium]TGP17910.1 porin family protein [Mesorhizobium sp. M1D.F.Ca.ET.231.01.1.1]TGP24557.1 porin family protein [Mesorhizobium sp. M1D.F.Ca.ET.234.01.1.1]TGS36754.1 porin family protein [Mesorhizobium sp. M1D.F.Ca.ET.184.01.1.1]TGS57916.1 porin family protein [Mesorhizobium sp. M1D.F.Ca.ET.183.01.1.1]
MKSLLLASVFCLAVGGPVMAADIVAPAATTEWTWQGAYAGAFGAGTLEHYKIREPNIGADVTHNVGSPTIGGFAGYNFQSGNIVYGVEGELGYRFKKSHFHDVPGPGDLDASLGLFGSLKGRVGMDMGGYLPFVAAGVTASRLKTNAIGFAERDATLVGGIVGAGVDVPLTHNVFLRGEYDFSFFGKKTLEYCGGGCVLEHTVQSHDFRVGVAMKF